jgi:hypothetical protein
MAFAHETFRTLPNNKTTKLPNITCVYCGGEHTADNPLTDEHVVGRKFVPKGSLATGWSLIVRACEHCNNEKSDLENDISAIKLLPDLGTSHDRAALAELAQRKAEGARSRRTGKPVANSYEEQTVEGTLMSAIDVRFGFTAPPQIAPERVMRLARFHLQAFFYFVTYDESARSGRFFNDLGWVNHARRSDWGNALQRGFADFVSSWHFCVQAIGTEENFKIAIRRDPFGADLCSFALEWNKSLRSIGFLGDRARAQMRGFIWISKMS